MNRAVSPTVTALVDTICPASPSDPSGTAYPSASSVGVDRDVAEVISGLPARQRREFASLLRAVESPPINLLLTGRPVRFSRLDAGEREQYLRGWASSRIAAKRRGFQAAKRLTTGLYFSRPLRDGTHPLWERIHYAPPAPTSGIPGSLVGLGPTIPEPNSEFETDVCVIGSGAGGGVIAARVAEAGYRVTVLEAGEWFPDLAYPRSERDAHDRLFFGRGIVTTADTSVAFLAGEAVGGSTAINWMTCLPPRPEARAEWAEVGGMTDVATPEFDKILGEVSRRLSVSTTESDVNPSNDALRRGCLALGYRQGIDWDIIPRNAVGCRSRCGFCTFGCPYSTRQSILVTFLADAMRRGARLLASTRADLIEVESGRVRGVRATYRANGVTREVHVRASAVVVAGGALQTPALLLRSGIRFPGVGVGLRVDPTTAVAGEFPDPVRTWEGPHQTIGVYRFQGSDAGAHGPWIEVAPAHPGLSGIALPWDGANEYRHRMERIEHTATPIVLVRDVAEGRVRIDSDGRPEFDYHLTDRDRTNLLRGIEETARLLRAAGATRLLSLHTPPIEVGGAGRPVTENELDQFVDQVRKAGIRASSVALFSAHPMGSARAGRDPRTSAARPTGEVHGVDGLWVGDGSLLPSSPGANPMISILALAWRTSGNLVAALGGNRVRENRPSQ
ncbi:MAG: GMC family oxidoreductase N-terminal domain-containing protein [Thermoplasmata archaeon]